MVHALAYSAGVMLPREEWGRCCDSVRHASTTTQPRGSGEILDIEQLVADAAVEALDEGVLRGRAWLELGGGRPGRAAPVPQRPGDELGTVVHADARAPRGGYQAFDHRHHLVGVSIIRP